MNREEYENLLQSDYWKGYSYSLIKERNFTCEDCGHSFPNQRNMLQVHHLVYRDVNPWSYRPDEIVVLCKECHQKRHGINPKTESINNVDIETHTQEGAKQQAYTKNLSKYNKRPIHYRQSKNNNGVIKYALLIFIFLMIVFAHIEDNTQGQAAKHYNNNITKNKQPVTTIKAEKTVDTYKNIPTQHSFSVINKPANLPARPPKIQINNELKNKPDISLKNKDNITNNSKTTIDLIEEKNHANIVEQAKKVGVSTEGSTTDILERIHHANIVERAKEAGVSTEGSTTDILERIHHANIIERAKEVGVSTEGSTTDILERIHHANIVERAKEAGVSTEGSTTDILERIHHANIIERAKEVGVSTEGSTTDILERITEITIKEYPK